MLKKNYHWLMMICCCMLIAASIGFFTNTYGAFYIALSEKLGIGRGEVAQHSSIAALIAGLLGPFAVRMLNRVDLRKILWTGTILLVGTTAAVVYANNAWQLNILGILRGIGCACYYKRRGREG